MTRNWKIIYLDFWKCYEDDLILYFNVFWGAELIKIGFRTQGYIIWHILANFCQNMAIFAQFYRKFLDYRQIFPS